jgi:hypothetical protein
MGMDERQRNAGIEEQAPDDEQERAAETTGEPAGAEPDRIWGADESVGDAASPGT